ncbi:MAG: DDE transposase family protein [Cyanobacteria bacterium J06638_22]
MNNDATEWYIVKQPDGHCTIVTQENLPLTPDGDTPQRWGPFSSQGEAIARRVGLIRAGKCQPM